MLERELIPFHASHVDRVCLPEGRADTISARKWNEKKRQNRASAEYSFISNNTVLASATQTRLVSPQSVVTMQPHVAHSGKK